MSSNDTSPSELREQLGRLQAMLSTVDECFKVVDSEFRLCDMNKAGLRMIEADSLDQVRGESVLQLVLPEYHDEFRSGVQRALRGERVVQEFEIQGLGGTRRWMQQVAVALPPLPDTTTPTQVAAFTRDVSDTKRAIELARAERDRAEAANRAKSEFLANMSHEIRTPMNAILGHLELLEPGQAGLTDAERLDCLSTLRRNADHLLVIIDDVLSLSKIEAGRIELETMPAPLDDLIGGVIRSFTPACDARALTLRAEATTRLPGVVVTDPVRLRQALMNLVGNAIKFTERGEIVLRAGYNWDAGELSIAVHDTGIGMSAEQLERVRRFDAFVQADSSTTRRFGGTGLGLRISAEFAQLLGGSLRVDSVNAQGSVFTLSIDACPRGDRVIEPGTPIESDATSRDAARLREPTSIGSLPGSRVLVVEDGIDNQKLVLLHLRRAGVEAHLAENGQQALDFLRNCPDRAMPELVLMDMQMPVLDGYAATARLREMGFAMPVVALTAHAMDSDRARCVAAGCNDYMTKPIDRATLLTVCGRWIETGRSAAA